MRLVALTATLVLTLFAAPHFAGAHEVYVLSPETIAKDLAGTSPNPFDAFWNNQQLFFFWGFVAVVVTLTIFFSTLFQWFEVRAAPFFRRLKPWAGLITRITLGTSLISAAYFQGLFGPELAFVDFAGRWAPLAQAALFLSGVCVFFGFLTRAAALLAIAVYAFGVARYGIYMLNYVNYLGEMLITLILGGGKWALDEWYPNPISRMRALHIEKLSKFEPQAFFILRVCFGAAVIFAAVYAKFLNSQLALHTIEEYHLTTYFPFEPLFIVLGAFIIECLIGLFFIFGVQVRWTAIFFLFWLALSLLYFGESVWPHIILIGVNFALLFHGYDRFSIQAWYFKRWGKEPIL